MSINDNFKSIRKHFGLTQEEFGEKLGVTRGVIYNIEKHLTDPKPYLVNQVSLVYGVDPFWLETGEGEMFQKPSEAEQFAELAAKIQSDPNEFKKRVFYALSLMSDEGWAAFEQAWNESEQKEKDTE